MARRTFHDPGVHGSFYDGNGHFTGSISGGGSTSQIVVKVKTFREYYKCNRCGHRWTKVVKKEYENYDL
jgi:hypothetical protein